MKSRSILGLLIAFGSFVLIETAQGETYTFTGAGNNANWSNPLNWENQIIPSPATDSTIIGGGSQDLGEDFDVGYLIGAHHHFLSDNSQSLRVHHQIKNMRAGLTHIKTIGDVSLIDTFGQMDLGLVTINGPINTAGAIRLALDGEGSVHVNAGSQLEAFVQLRLDSLGGSGVFDLMGDIEMTGSQPADLTSGTLDLGANQFLPDGPGSGTLSIAGNLNLGAWRLQGGTIYPTDDEIDRVNVSGQLDLTNAYFTSDSIARPLHSDPNQTHHVIATYGNRVGSLPQTTIPYGYSNVFDAPIVYTSGENAGPGEIWLVVPEPTSAAVVALAISLALQRRKQTS